MSWWSQCSEQFAMSSWITTKQSYDFHLEASWTTHIVSIYLQKVSKTAYVHILQLTVGKLLDAWLLCATQFFGHNIDSLHSSNGHFTQVACFQFEIYSVSCIFGKFSYIFFLRSNFHFKQGVKVVPKDVVIPRLIFHFHALLSPLVCDILGALLQELKLYVIFLFSIHSSIWRHH